MPAFGPFIRRRNFLAALSAVQSARILQSAGEPPILFSCDITRVSQGLKVDYSVRNRSGSDIGIFNRIPTVEMNRISGFRPENAYIDLHGSTLELRKMALPLPSGVTMNARPLPYVTRLSDGQSLHEELILKEPVLVDDPMRRASLSAASPGKTVSASHRRVAASVAFSLGVFQGDPAIRFIAFSAAYPDVYRVWPPGVPVDRQQVLTKRAPVSPSVVVMDYE